MAEKVYTIILFCISLIVNEIDDLFTFLKLSIVAFFVNYLFTSACFSMGLLAFSYCLLIVLLGSDCLGNRLSQSFCAHAVVPEQQEWEGKCKWGQMQGKQVLGSTYGASHRFTRRHRQLLGYTDVRAGANGEERILSVSSLPSAVSQRSTFVLQGMTCSALLGGITLHSWWEARSHVPWPSISAESRREDSQTFQIWY